jgi:2-polyprenyl-6-hydroxyphenyl methylase/3-demethylubiquinone-9 3-methyltransferase
MMEVAAPAAGVSGCKVCREASTLYGVVDFNKNCEEQHGKFLPLAGVPVYYYRCGKCGLVFTRAFDDWDVEDYRRNIYNEGYGEVDPDYLEARPAANARQVAEFIRRGSNLRVLDYGGGNGRLSELLRRQGVRSKTWDPMEENMDNPASNSFDLVTAFEVFEHTPAPHRTASEAVRFLKDEGVLLFSTLTVDALPPNAISFWYIAPRNGHVTVYTKESLRLLFAACGYSVHHFNDGAHLAYRRIPKWLA